MQHWQQQAERQDPFPDVPFDDGRRWHPDTLVGLTCAIVGALGVLVEILKRVA
jgi:hypothetical protein